MLDDIEEKKGFSRLSFTGPDTLTKLRIMALSILVLSTLAFVLVFFIDFVIAAALVLIGYIVLIVLTVQLFLLKRL